MIAKQRCGAQELEDNRAAVASGRRRGRRKRLQEIEVALTDIRSTISALEAELLPLDLRISECSAAGISPSDVSAAAAHEQVAGDDWRSATSHRDPARKRLQEIARKLKKLEKLPELSVADNQIIELCEFHGSVDGLLRKLKALREGAIALDRERRKLEAKIEKLRERLRQIEVSVVTEAKVVGTTLAQLMLHKGLVDRDFDFVIIDEASTALPFHVYVALTKARVGGALIGDFEQNGPISNTSPSKTPPSIRPWLHANVFELVGVSDLTTAQSTVGCTALRDQYRFGPLTTEIANRVAYKGLLRSANWAPPHPNGDPEISIIDTSALEGAGTYEIGPRGKGRWWAAGAALSSVLAKRHGFSNVGIVTPYRLQAQLTEALIREAGGGATQVGTAHSFQGQEYETVVFDLVEDGDGTSWVSSASRDKTKWALDGVRLFNVAVTRNTRRLYIIANAGSIRSARTGPLSVLGDLIRSELIKVIDARKILDAPLESSLTNSLRHADLLAESTPILVDSFEFYRRLEQEARAVLSRVVIISPFVGSTRLNQIRPMLQDLVQRGVDVRCVVTPGQSDREIALRRSLRATGASVNEIPNFHEKVVILDDDVTYVGSLNALSNTSKTSELMLRFEGRASTRLVEDWMRSALRRL